MTSDERGFFSMDVLIAFTLVLLVSLSFLNVYKGRESAAEELGQLQNAKMVGEQLASAINSVYAGGPKSSLSVDLPENVGGSPYSVKSDNASGIITVESSSSVRVGVLCRNFENFDLPWNVLGGQIRIRWQGDQIRVEPV